MTHIVKALIILTISHSWQTIASTAADILVNAKHKKAPSLKQTSKSIYKVAIVQIVHHTSLDQVRKGVENEVHRLVKKKHLSIKFDYYNANGNSITMMQIAKKVIGERPDAIVAIGTPAAQAVVNKNKTIPVIFSPITDPVEARLVASWNKPGGIATGTSDLSPMQEQIKLIKKLIPTAKSIAIMYNPGEANSTTLVKNFNKYCKQNQINPMQSPVQSSATVISTAKSIRADVIYVPTDNTVVSAIEGVIKAAIANKKPLFAAEEDSVKKGALATIAVDYYKLGQMTANMLIDILLNKAQPKNMPVRKMSTYKTYINKKSATLMGITIPESLKKHANIIN